MLVIDPDGTFGVYIVQPYASLEVALLTDYHLASALSLTEDIRNSLGNQGSPSVHFYSLNERENDILPELNSVLPFTH